MNVSVDRTISRGLVLVAMVLTLQAVLDQTVNPVHHSIVGGSSLFAQANKEDPRPERNVPSMSESVYEQLSKFSYVLVPEQEEGEGIWDLSNAQEILDRLLARSNGLNGNELAQIHRNYGWLAQEMGDTRLAIHHLTQVLEYRTSIRYAQEEMTLNNLSKLHFSLGNFEEALDFANQFMDLSADVQPRDYLWVAQIYYQLENFESLKYWIKLAIEGEQQSKRPIKEHWWHLLLTAVHSLEEWDEAVNIYEKLVVEHPKEAYWIALAQAYAQMDRDDDAAAALKSANELRESENAVSPSVPAWIQLEEEYLPLVKVRPEYPQRALERGIEGYVVLSFTVTETGSVENPEVVVSNPPGVFDQSAIQAARKFKYKAKILDGRPVAVQDVLHRISYEFDDQSTRAIEEEYLPLVKVRPEYPQRALERGIEGYVVLSFTVTETGSVESPVVVDGSPPGIFERSAMQAVKKFRYEPKTLDGHPVSVSQVTYRLDFKLDDDVEEIGSIEEGDEYLPLVKVSPEYPQRALERGIEGYVVLSYTVTKNGSVEDAVVVEASPPGMFERSAIQAALEFKYKPKILDGKPVDVQHVRHRITYEIDDVVEDADSVTDTDDYLPLVKVAPQYPKRAIARGIEGYVVLSFTVTKTGSVEDPVVVEASPPGMFERSAIQAALKFKYKPKIVDGEPISTSGVRHRISFEIEDES